MFEKLLNLQPEQIKEAKNLAREWMDEFTYSPHNRKNFKLENLSDKLDVCIGQNDYTKLLLGYALAIVLEEQTEADADVEADDNEA